MRSRLREGGGVVLPTASRTASWSALTAFGWRMTVCFALAPRAWRALVRAAMLSTARIRDVIRVLKPCADLRQRSRARCAPLCAALLQLWQARAAEAKKALTRTIRGHS